MIKFLVFSFRLAILTIITTFTSAVALQVQTQSGMEGEGDFLAKDITVVQNSHDQSVVFSPLTLVSDRDDFGYLVGRQRRSAGRYNLVLFKQTIGTDGEHTIEPVKNVLDTTGGVQVHTYFQNGRKNFRILSAYDPSVAWYRGTYWVAFECILGPDDKRNLGIKGSASICIGPMKLDKTIDTAKIRVLVAGGMDQSLYDNRDDEHYRKRMSASVPKLIAEGDRLFILWSSVTINFNNGFIENRRVLRRDEITSRLGGEENADVNRYNKFIEIIRGIDDGISGIGIAEDEFGYEAEYLDFDYWWNHIMEGGGRCSPLNPDSDEKSFLCTNSDEEYNNLLNLRVFIKDRNAEGEFEGDDLCNFADKPNCESRIKMKFYQWQANLFSTVDSGLNWFTTSTDGAVSGLGISVKGPMRFEKVETYGKELIFRDNDSNSETLEVPLIRHPQRDIRDDWVVFAWDTEKFTKVLGVESSRNGYEIVADVADVKKIGNKFYYTVMRGGAPHGWSSEEGGDISLQNYCSSPTTGQSNIGCYRMEIISADVVRGNPIVNLNATEDITRNPSELNMCQFLLGDSCTSLDEGGPGYFKSTPHEYSRFYKKPGDNRTYLMAKFVDHDAETASCPTDEPNCHNIRLKSFRLNLHYRNTNPIKNRILHGRNLKRDQTLMSNNERFALYLTRKGMYLLDREDLTLKYKKEFSLNGPNPIMELRVGRDNNLVLYRKNQTPVCNNEGYEVNGDGSVNKTSRLILQNDGNLVHKIFSDTGESPTVFWDWKTGSGQFSCGP